MEENKASQPATKQPVHAVIFDLDGVIVTTDEFHYRGWQQLADEEGVYFDRHINERLRGVSRTQSLEILLERATRTYSDEEKTAMAARKNGYYGELIKTLTPADLLPGVAAMVDALKARGVKVAIASSSKNTPVILERIGMTQTFDTVVSGNDIRQTKPDPEIFLLAASQCGVPPEQSLVVEDAAAGVEGALNAKMRVLAVGSAARDRRATARAVDLSTITVDELLAI